MNGAIQALPDRFSPSNGAYYTYPGQKIALVNGIPYMVGYHYGYHHGLAMIVNGEEYPLDPYWDKYNLVHKLQRHRNDVYTLTCNEERVPPLGKTTVFKGTEPIEINAKVYIPNVRYFDFGFAVDQGGDTVNLADFSITDFAVLDK